MKVLWLSHRDIDHPRAGGAERTIYEVGSRLATKGHEFIWHSVSYSRNEPFVNIAGMKVVRARSNISAHLTVKKTISKFLPDVIVDDLGHAVPWFSERLTKIPGTVFFRHLHKRSLAGQVSPPMRITISKLESLYSHIYRKWPFVTESESSISDLKELSIPSYRIRKIPPGLNTDVLVPETKFENPTIVYFGGFRKYKRPCEAVYILKSILPKIPDARLIMIGSGPSLEEAKRLAEKLSINGKINFTGRIGYETLQKYVSRSWVNIHSSVTEGFGYSVIEASSMGTPTVAYNVPGIREAIKDGKNGFLISDGNREIMADKVKGILECADDNLSKSARRESLLYSWDTTADMWEQHLQEITL